MVLIKTSAIVAGVLLLQLLTPSVFSNENDDLVFDSDGKGSIHVASIKNPADDELTFFKRIKRGFSWPWDSFVGGDSTTSTPAPTSTTTEALAESLSQTTAVPKHREARNSAEVDAESNDVIGKGDEDDEDDIGDVAAGRVARPQFGNTDDEDLAAGSGEVEGSATEVPVVSGVHNQFGGAERPVNRQARFYRVTLTLLEPFVAEYEDPYSQDYIQLSRNLTDALTDLLNHRIPYYNHFANVVKISKSEDPFNSEATLDIGSTYTNENEIREILENQLHYHTLGSIKVAPEGFTFRSFQAHLECPESTSLKCRDGTCVSLSSRCDGVPQCPDQSDELDCPVTTVRPSEETTYIPSAPRVDERAHNCRGDDSMVRCSDGSRYICSAQKCDGVNDCDDSGDEKGCPHSCGAREFACDVSRCIQDKQRCDFIDDCEDGSDERACLYPACTQSEFRCRSGQCIENRQRCNGAPDCYDKTDELNCPCKADEFECAALYCIPKERRCDGVHDCSNGHDEVDCKNTTHCRSGEFECDDGTCIHEASRCDGRSDCPDRSDEKNCTVTTCSSDQFRCADGTCVNIDKRCNGHNDCRNGEDESQCGCGAQEFNCNDGQCIAYALQCNGYSDCRDGSDERDCENTIWRNIYNEKYFVAARSHYFMEKLRKMEKILRIKCPWRFGSLKFQDFLNELFYFDKNILQPMLKLFPEIKLQLIDNSIEDNVISLPQEEVIIRDHKNSLSKNELVSPLRILRDKTNSQTTGNYFKNKKEKNIQLKKSASSQNSIKLKNLQINSSRNSIYNRHRSFESPSASKRISWYFDKYFNPKNRSTALKQTNQSARVSADKVSINFSSITNNSHTGDFGKWLTDLKLSRDDWSEFKRRNKSIPTLLNGSLSVLKPTHVSNNRNIVGNTWENFNIKIINDTGIDTFQNTTVQMNDSPPLVSLVAQSLRENGSEFHFKLTTVTPVNHVINSQRFKNNVLSMNNLKFSNNGSRLIRPTAPATVPAFKYLTKSSTRRRDSPETEKNPGILRTREYFTKWNVNRTISHVKNVESPQSKSGGHLNTHRTLGKNSKINKITLELNLPTKSSELAAKRLEKIESLRNKSNEISRLMTDMKFNMSNDNSGQSGEKCNNTGVNYWKNKFFELYNKNKLTKLVDPMLVDGKTENLQKLNTSERIDGMPEVMNKMRVEPNDQWEGGKSEEERRNSCRGKKRRGKHGNGRRGCRRHTHSTTKRSSDSSTQLRVLELPLAGNSTAFSAIKNSSLSTVGQYTHNSARKSKPALHILCAWFGRMCPEDITEISLPFEGPLLELLNSSAVNATTPRASINFTPVISATVKFVPEQPEVSASVEPTLLAEYGQKARDYLSLNKNQLFHVKSWNLPDKKISRRQCDRKKFFLCNDGSCIPRTQKCDGFIDCSDGSDEFPWECNNLDRGGLAPCPSMDFTCGDGSCIPRTSVCDGFDDCPRAEDELNCDRGCTPTQFRCTGGKCIEAVYRCDGHPDCPDSSDEDCEDSSNHTTTLSPRIYSIDREHNSVTESVPECDARLELRCGDGKCISQRRKCDGIADCSDRSDERDCGSCAIDEWRCSSGECLPERVRCDGRSQCRDGSDEAACVNECPPGTFRCDDGVCLDERRRCDGRAQCRDASDEINCQAPYCPDGQLACASGVCIAARFFCDRHVDCLDGSDEHNCETTAYPPATECRNNEYTCRDRTCIPSTAVCDGRPDCSTNEDELDCRGCARDQFQCTNGDCISAEQKCNGLIDCDDGSDEDGCVETTTIPSGDQHCPSGQFTCHSDGSCVHYSSRCNGIPECRDGSDEEACHTEETGGLNIKTYPSEQIIKENPVRQGREVVFQCRDEGPLRARVHWVRANNLPLPPGSRDINGRLEMPNIQLEHAGAYICEAQGYPASIPGQRVSVHLEVEKFESPAPRPARVCKYDEATCSNGDCIAKSFVCDGKFDCTDGSDEMRCNPHGCEPNQFRCANKQCVSKIWRCDGDKDCVDGSDEENCAPPPPGSPCRYDEFQCHQYDQCIPKSYHCDMERDCQDGSDEIGCSPVYIIKPPPPMVVLEPGETMSLSCTAIGVPIPEINWRLNWGHVPSKCSSTSVNGTGTLDCPDIAVSDQGAYSCEAINIGGFVFAVPDAILVVKEPSNPCPKGKFNSEARRADECIPCFCFGVVTECRSANLFTYQIPPPFDRHKLVAVITSGRSVWTRGELSNQNAEVQPIGRNGVDISIPYSDELSSNYDIPYYALPETYHGSQLKSYGGYLRYNVRYRGDGRNNSAPAVILSGNKYFLVHRGRHIVPDRETEVSVRFFVGDWHRVDNVTERLATRQDIMMALANVDNILIKAKYDDSPQLDIAITDIIMDTADSRNTGLGSASFVEECSCPSGYTGNSCEHCAPGHIRRKSGPWLGECYRDEPPCPPGYFGDPSRNIPCMICPCPLTNPANQFARTCRLGPDRQPICDCPAGYTGQRCEQCALGYHGNPLIAGDMCVRDQQCDPHGSLTPTAAADGKCRCKLYATGLTCDQCKPNTFNLASKNQFGCISCFCMGITNRCVSSNWYRNEIRVSFTNSIRDFTLVESLRPEAPAIVSGIRLDSIRREITYSEFPNRANSDVYYWQLPSIFLGDRVTSYGGYLRYTVRYVPSPGGQISRNNAADVELISANDIKLLYYSKESPEANSLQSFEVPLLEQYWQRTDGTETDREHLLMALADVQAIRIKATYTTHTDEAAISLVSLDTAEKYNTGKERAVEVEECSCPAGYSGPSCEDCAAGFTRISEGLYLGVCRPCSCNGHSTQCDPESGVCENCGDHTTGENCELCAPGYEGNATRGSSDDCRRESRPPVSTDCNCNPAGSQYSQCINEQCTCKTNVEGSECSRCRLGTFGLSAENPNGCNECYCSGVTDQCHESSLYLQEIPMWVYDAHHGFTLTDTLHNVIDDGFDINVARNEIGYRFTPRNRNHRLFWSLPATFTGNKIKSYGGNLTLTQRFSAPPGARPLKDQDVVISGNGHTLYWTNSRDLVAEVTTTYSVPLRESEWRRLAVEGPRQASRADLMTVLSNLESILVRATHSEGMIASFISDIILDTAVENLTGNKRATQIEACRCPVGYTGTSCESCARGYYRDTTDRSVSLLGSCNACPCNDHEESCDFSSPGHVRCHCLAGYTGLYCQDSVDQETTPYPTLAPPPSPPKIVVRIQEKKFQIVHTGSTVRYHCSGRTHEDSPLRIRWEKEGGRLPDRSHDDAEGLLIIRDVRVSDSGVYICHASDGVNVALDKVTLTVGGSNPIEPRTTISPLYQTVQEGDPVEFRCEATGNPQPELDWIRVHGRINAEAVFSNGIWRVPAVTKEDAGEYKCIARNSIGITEQTTHLYVSDNPDRQRPDKYYDKGPVITPEEWVGSAGDIIRLVCTRSQYHENVSWTRSSGLPLPSSASQREGILTISNPGVSDSGVYVCIATSYQGSESSTTAKISIHPKRNPPRVRVEPERQVVSQGTGAEIKCHIDERDQSLQVQWSKYGESSLPPNVQQHGNILKINNPQVSDRGVYICRAANPSGVFEASALVEVERRESPVLELYPRNVQTVTLGGSVDLQCRVVAGFPVPSFHWAREDQHPLRANVEQLPGGLLRLTNVTIYDSGAYVCSATNEVGSTSAVARIEVQSMPVITITPTSGIILARLGSRVRLTCSAEGIPQPNVVWVKGDSVYRHYTPYQPVAPTPLSAIHEIVSMSVDDEGSYTCQATNAAGITEERIQVQIEDDGDNDINPPCHGDVPCERPAPGDPDSGSLVNPPRRPDNGFKITEENLRIPINGNVEIRCHVRRINDLKIHLDWKRSDRRPLPPNATVQGNLLTIPNVNRDAAGDYVCVGLNYAGIEVFRAITHLEIISMPRIVLNPNRQTVAPGESASITCSATGDEPLRIEWAAIGRPLPPTVRDEYGTLRFHGITFDDAGKYVCKASNDAGTAEAVAEVLVNERSYNDAGIRAVEREVNTVAGNSVTMRCDTRERVTIHWTRENQELPRNSRVGDNYLELTRAKPEDSGRYICQIRNAHGGSSDYVNLHVAAASGPGIRIEPSSDIVNIGDTVDLRCVFSTRHSDRPRFQWTKNDRDPLPPNAQAYGDNLRIGNVQMSDSGNYRCHVHSQEGAFSEEYPLIVQGGENDEPAIELKRVPYGSSIEMECRVDLEGPVTYKWSKLNGILPVAIMKDNKMKLPKVKAEDAGTYICTASNDVASSEGPTVLVVTGVIPNFSQAPRSYIALPPIPDSYLKFNIEVSFKPESYDGIVLYNAQYRNGSGDFVILSLVAGYPEFKYELGSGPITIRADKPVTIGEWHTIKLQRNRRDGQMVVDGVNLYKGLTAGRKVGLDLKAPLYIGGVPEYVSVSDHTNDHRVGIVGCVARVVLNEKNLDLIGDQTDSLGVTTCETCAENPCHNLGVCQEAPTHEGYTCLCRAGYSGLLCNNTGEACYPGACGVGHCRETANGLECSCPHGYSGRRCENALEIHQPSFRNQRSFLAYDTPKGGKRNDTSKGFSKKKRSHELSYLEKLKSSRAAHLKNKHHHKKN